MGRDIPSASPLILRQLTLPWTRHYARTVGSGVVTARSASSALPPNRRVNDSSCKLPVLGPQQSMWESDVSTTHTEPPITQTPDQTARYSYPSMSPGTGNMAEPVFEKRTRWHTLLGADGSQSPVSGPAAAHRFPTSVVGALSRRHKHPPLAPTPRRSVIGNAIRCGLDKTLSLFRFVCRTCSSARFTYQLFLGWLQNSLALQRGP